MRATSVRNSYTRVILEPKAITAAGKGKKQTAYKCTRFVEWSWRELNSRPKRFKTSAYKLRQSLRPNRTFACPVRFTCANGLDCQSCLRRADGFRQSLSAWRPRYPDLVTPAIRVSGEPVWGRRRFNCGLDSLSLLRIRQRAAKPPSWCGCSHVHFCPFYGGQTPPLATRIYPSPSKPCSPKSKNIIAHKTYPSSHKIISGAQLKRMRGAPPPSKPMPRVTYSVISPT